MRNERRGCSCGSLLVATLLIVVLGVAAYAFWLRPLVSAALLGGGDEGLPPQLGEQAGEQIPTVIAALPAGTLTISEQDVNGYIAANPDALKPLESVTVAFTPGQVTANLRAFGTTSTATTGLAVADGSLVAVSPTISGPLGALVAADVVARSLTDQINRELRNQGRRAQDVRVEQGQIVITIE